MDNKISPTFLFQLLKPLTLLPAGIACLLTLSVSATESGNASAMPDYGEDDCVSFKEGNNVNPLNFTFGYACVSKASCEVFEHGCIDKICHFPDYSKGTRTTLSPVPVMTPVNKINMAAVGINLKSHTVRWCLIQDGSGKFWALDRLRGTQEKFSLKNQNETIVNCNRNDLFSSSQGCFDPPHKNGYIPTKVPKGP